MDNYKDSLFSQYPKYRVPFFKYLLNTPKLGLRNIFLGIIKDARWDESKGFVPTEGYIGNEEVGIDSSIVISRLAPEYIEIEKICIENNVKIIFFTSPIFNSSQEFLFSFSSAQYLDFSDSLQNPTYYKDQTHLNSNGAEKFTKVIYNKLISLRY